MGKAKQSSFFQTAIESLGEESIKRKVGEILSEKDQFVFRILFYRFNLGLDTSEKICSNLSSLYEWSDRCLTRCLIWRGVLWRCWLLMRRSLLDLGSINVLRSV